MQDSQINFVRIPVSKGSGAEACRLGQMMHEQSQTLGAHNTPAAEPKNSLLSHIKGKYGEIAFAQWLTSQGLTASHNPFRDNYTIKVDDDDFIVNGLKLEIKSKQRGERSKFPPSSHYNVNLGKKTVENCIHIFLEISGKVAILKDPEVALVGWATPKIIFERGEEVWPGKISANRAFPFQRHDWDIAISDLLPGDTLLERLKS